MSSDPLSQKSYKQEISNPPLQMRKLKLTFFQPYHVTEKPYHVIDITSQWVRGMGNFIL